MLMSGGASQRGQYVKELGVAFALVCESFGKFPEVRDARMQDGNVKPCHSRV